MDGVGASPFGRLGARLWLMAYGPPARESRDPRHYRVLVHSLFSSPTSIILSNVVGAAISLFCWKSSGNPVFVPLFLVTASIVALRIVTVARYHAAIRRRELTDPEIKQWDREFFVGATAFSAVLGVMCYIALAWTDDIPSHIITIVAAIAFSAGYVARNAGRPIFVIVQLLAFCVPMCIGLSQNEHPFYPVVAAFIAFFIITNVAIAFSLNRNLLELAAARKRSETLASSLRSKNLTLDSALNSMIHGLVMFSADLELELANSRFAEMYRLSAADLAPGTLFTTMLDRLIAAQVLAPPAARDLGAVARRALRSGQTTDIEILTERGQIFVVHAELTSDGGSNLTVQAGKPPLVNGQLEERMRVGCGSATIGMFAKQWEGFVDEVVVVDDHITGILSEHQAGKVLGIPDTGIKIKGRRSTPGRYFQVAEPGTGWGGTDISDPLSILQPFDPKVARPGLTMLMTSTTGEHSAYFVLDEALRPVETEMPDQLRRSVELIRENCEPALSTVLFMAGAGGSLRSGVTENPVRLTRSVKDTLTLVTCGGAPTYVWPGGGITFMVDVTRVPENAFGYVPTPALVAPIEFTLRLEDYERLGGHMSEVRRLAEAHGLSPERRSVRPRSDNPWPLGPSDPRRLAG